MSFILGDSVSACLISTGATWKLHSVATADFYTPRKFLFIWQVLFLLGKVLFTWQIFYLRLVGFLFAWQRLFTWQNFILAWQVFNFIHAG
jgi:hypothetical protein